MQIIDSHQHFWKYDEERHSWINEEMAVLKRDYLPDGLQEVYTKNGVVGSIAVQAEQSEEETEFLLELAKENDFIKGVVGWVDLRSPQLMERLEYFSAFEKLKGFRHIIQDEPDINFMLDDDFQNGIGLLEKYNFTYDILIYSTQMKAALQTVKNFPNQAFVIDHIAKPNIKSRQIDSWTNYIKAIGEHENVFCKISGMITEAHWRNWSYQDFVPYLDVVFEAFGSERVMFGSDYPVCLLAGSYENVKDMLEHYVTDFSEDEKSGIWGGNALRFYGV